MAWKVPSIIKAKILEETTINLVFITCTFCLMQSFFITHHYHLYFIKETAGFDIIVNPAKNIKINILTNTLFKIKHKKSIVKVNITFARGSFFANFEM